MAARPTRRRSLRVVAEAARAAGRPGSPSLVTRVRALPRLVEAVRSGEYAGASTGSLVALAAAAAYVLSPVDLVPEALVPVLGLGDDTVVLAWGLSQLVLLTEDFLRWERSRGRRPRPGEPATVTVADRVRR